MTQSSPTKTPIKVKEIKHVALIVNDLERSREFYCDILGMELMDRPAFDFPGMWFRAGGTELHLILHQDDCADVGYPNEKPNTREGLVHHFAFEVDNAFEAGKCLKENGVPMAGGPPGRRPDCAQLWCYDPDGHIVELFGGSRTSPTA